VLESKRSEMEAIQAEYSKRKAVVESFQLAEVDLQTQLEDAARMVRVIQQEGKALEKRLADVRKKQEQHRTTYGFSFRMLQTLKRGFDSVV
jgi:predicted  nucleic acid-binding Zn-ribbon protein